MTQEQQSINNAFAEFLGSYLSLDAREKIAAAYGEAIAAKVREIYDDALNCSVDWSRATIDTALPVMHSVLDTKYPWLSKAARSALVHAFIMEWK